MNSRRAKLLRSIAQVQTSGLPQIRMMVNVHDNGQYTLFMHKECTRSVYQQLKRGYYDGLSLSVYSEPSRADHCVDDTE